jgi:Rrf2 family protein
LVKGLRLAESTLLAFHSLAYIAVKDRKVNNKEIADSIGASKDHMSKVLQRLVKHHILSSTRGPKGGFYLNKKAGDLSLLDIYRAMEGRLEVSSEDYGEDNLYTEANLFRRYLFTDLYDRIGELMRDYFSQRTLADLVKEYFTFIEDHPQ